MLKSAVYDIKKEHNVNVQYLSFEYLLLDRIFWSNYIMTVCFAIMLITSIDVNLRSQTSTILR